MASGAFGGKVTGTPLQWYDNPLVRSIAGQSNALIGLGSGLLSGNTFANGLAAGGQAYMQGAQADDAYATSKKEEAARQQQLTKTMEFLQRTAPQYADAVNAGVLSPVDAYKMATTPKGSGTEYRTVGNNIIAIGADGTVNPVYTAPAEAPKPTSSIQEYNLAVTQGFKGSFADYEKEMRKAGATNIDFNANQGTAAAYADRMASAETILSDPKIVSAMTDVGEAVKGATPLVGNFLTSAEKQQADQAQRDFINAILRRESGAVISPSEFESARQQYFPQPGDTPTVIQQKADNRRTAIQGVTRAAGPNYAPPSLSPGAGGVVDWTTYFGGQ